MYPFIQLMRLDKPIGIWLLFFPAGWAVALAEQELWPCLILEIMMLLGAVFTRAAGCIVNDIVDRRLDIAVERTRFRPIASGAVTIPQAIILLLFLLLLALLIAIRLPPAVFYLSLLALPMIAIYPYMKRLTWWPQAFLGLTFNFGALMGWVATGHSLQPAAFSLYFATFFWTLGYDTIYAVQDMEDDTRAGIKSSARALGPRLPAFVMACYGFMFILLVVTGLLTHAGFYYYGALALVAAHAAWQVKNLPPSREQAWSLFKSNQWLGLILLIGMLAPHFH